MMAPHWNMNAHSIMYVTRGSGRVQIVGENGETVFDDTIEENQLVVVPQNYGVLKKAGDRGLEWVAIKTVDNAMISQLAGKSSVLRSIPEHVLRQAFGIPWEAVEKLKNNRQEITVLPPLSRSQERDV